MTIVLEHKVDINENNNDMEGCNDMLMSFSSFCC